MFSSQNSQVSSAANYIEDVFSTYLYTGGGTSQTITNGIDLSTKGGMVWLKRRDAVGNNVLYDTARGATKVIISNTTDAESTATGGLNLFNTDGFRLGNVYPNTGGATFASWTFREQPKFFDVVTYTGNGVSGRTISHSLGSTPGCVIVKCTNGAGTQWIVHHRSLTSGYNIFLNSTAAGTSYPEGIQSAASTTFTIGSDSDVNLSGATYVAYLFAHNAGGFGLTGTDNVISCGSFSGNTTVTLGYEPQWILVKRSDSTGSWYLQDTMRGWPVSGDANYLYANTSNLENQTSQIYPNATGFSTLIGAGNFIYIAIRRGPMKVPTTGTSVFGLNARTGTGANATVTGGQTDDTVLIKNRGITEDSLLSSRLTGKNYLITSSTGVEVVAGTNVLQTNPWDVMNGVKVGDSSTITNASANTFINYLFKRAPSFFDVVCYTGTGANQTLSHNLKAIPELIISKSRSSVQDWGGLRKQIDGTYVFGMSVNSSAALQYGSGSGFTAGDLSLSATTFNPQWFENSAGSTSSNTSGTTYVAYLFATCAGVSKVGNYTGNGSTQTINCGFTGGARFVMIKRTASTGDWYVWDTARGIVTANDPHLSLNTTAAEVTTDDTIDTDSTGFVVNQVTATNVNVSSATYIYLAIA